MWMGDPQPFMYIRNKKGPKSVPCPNYQLKLFIAGEPPLDRPQALRAPVRVPGRDPRRRQRAVG